MKGIVFTEFIEMVEEVYSPEMVDILLDSVTLSSKGAYTSVGTYDHHELVVLVAELSKRTGTEIPVAESIWQAPLQDLRDQLFAIL